jgi:hypothetical protein
MLMGSGGLRVACNAIWQRHVEMGIGVVEVCAGKTISSTIMCETILLDLESC